MNGVFFASVYDYRSVALSAAIALSATTLSFISYLKSDGCNLNEITAITDTLFTNFAPMLGAFNLLFYLEV